MCRHVHHPDDILPLHLHIHRPRSEVNLPRDLVRHHPLHRRTPRLIPRALLEITLVLEHHLLPGDLHRRRAIARVRGQPGIRIPGSAPRRRRRALSGVMHTSGNAQIDLPSAALQDTSMPLA